MSRVSSPHPEILWTGVLLILLTAALRIIGVNGFAVWTDEGFTVWVIEHIEQVLPRVAQDRHPPLYFLSLALWQDVAGLSRLALRWPSVMSGVITVALLWRVGRLVGGPWVGAAAGVLFAVTPSAIYYTQEIRHFGWLLMAVTLSSWLFLRVMRRPNSLRYTLYAVSVALIMYTLYIGFFVVIAQVIVALFVWRGGLANKARFIAAWALALGLFAPWLYVIFTQQLQLMGVGIAGVGNVPGFDLMAIGSLLRDLLGNGLPFLVVAWGLAWVPLRQGWADPDQRVGLTYVLLWGLGMFVIMAVINTQFTLFRMRTVLMLLPGFALLAALGLRVLPWRAGVVAFAVVVGFTAYRDLPVQVRGAMPLLAEAIAEDYQPTDLIVVETGWSDDEFIYEIRHELGWDIDIIRTLQWVDGRGEDKLVVLEIEDQLRAAERIWVIHWNQPPSVVPWLQGTDQSYDEVRYTRHTVGPEVEQYMDGFFARIDGDYRLYLFENREPTVE
jgi:4-amino-4-deoxy-L-arabinose transferase-like glycosyltransferase